MRARTGLVAGVLAVVAAGAVAVAVGIALLLTHIVDLRRGANATLRAGNYLEATIGVESLVVDAETGLRGYVITGQPLFLAPERTASAQMPAAAGALRRAAASDGAYVTQASALAASARSYLSTYVPRVIEQVRTNPATARSEATTVLGKRLVDGIREQAARLEQSISASQASRQRAARESADNAVTVGIVVLIALTLLTVALGGILGRLVIGRERARERASFLAEASARLDRPVTSREVLDVFVGLVLERGNQLCLAEELVGGETRPEGQPGRARTGDAALEAAVGSSEAQDAWNQVRRTAETSARTAAHATAADAGEQRVHLLTVAGVARGSLVTRVRVARRHRDWRPEEIDELIGLTERLALALHARALYARTESLYRASEQTALTLQRSLLPGEIPDVPSCEVAIRFAPAGAGDLVGGDFYDVFPVGSNHWAVVIGDVCGKGAGAAAVTAMARWTLRSLAGAVRSPAEVLRIVNDTMLRQPSSGGSSRSCTRCSTSVAPTPGSRSHVADTRRRSSSVRTASRRAWLPGATCLGCGPMSGSSKPCSACGPARASSCTRTESPTGDPASTARPSKRCGTWPANRTRTRSPTRCSTRPGAGTAEHRTTWQSSPCASFPKTMASATSPG
jgi:CHASE3 domain sensor protein